MVGWLWGGCWSLSQPWLHHFRLCRLGQVVSLLVLSYLMAGLRIAVPTTEGLWELNTFYKCLEKPPTRTLCPGGVIAAAIDYVYCHYCCYFMQINSQSWLMWETLQLIHKALLPLKVAVCSMNRSSFEPALLFDNSFTPKSTEYFINILWPGRRDLELPGCLSCASTGFYSWVPQSAGPSDLRLHHTRSCCHLSSKAQPALCRQWPWMQIEALGQYFL